MKEKNKSTQWNTHRINEFQKPNPSRPSKLNNKHKVQEFEKKPRVHTLSHPSPLLEEILSPRTLNPTTWKNKRYSPPHNLSNELSKDCHEDKHNTTYIHKL